MKIIFFQIIFYLSFIYSQNLNAQLSEDESGNLILSLNPSFNIISFSIEHNGCIDFVNYLDYPIMQYWNSEFIENKIFFEANNSNGNIYPLPNGAYTIVASLLGNQINQNCIDEITASSLDNQYLIAQWCDDQDEDQICDELEISNININSNSHPSENLWYNNNIFNYDISTDLALGFYYKLTTDSNYILSLNDSFSTDWQGSFHDLEHGTHYLHVIPMDYNYNFLTNKYKKFKFNINQNPVQISSLTHQDENIAYENSNPFFIFQSKPGINNFYWLIDRDSITIPNPDNSEFLSNSNLMLNGLENGTHYLHVVGIDEIGDLSHEAHFQINILAETILFGCIDPNACNYQPEAIYGDNSCLYEVDCFGNCGGSFDFDDCGECNGPNYFNDENPPLLPNEACGCPNEDGVYPFLDCSGECGGVAVEDCFGECGGDALIDECGICDGDGSSCEHTVILEFVGLYIDDNGFGYIDIDITNPINIVLFQFDVSGINITNATGGVSEENGFDVKVNSSGTTVTGISFDGNTIPSNSDSVNASMLTMLTFENGGGEVCMSNITVLGTSNNEGFIPLNVVPPDCLSIDQEVVLGCIDLCANNFNPMANFDDGTCDYSAPDLNGDGEINILDTVKMIEIILNN